MLAFESSLSLGAGGWSCSNFLAATVRVFLWALVMGSLRFWTGPYFVHGMSWVYKISRLGDEVPMV